MNLHAIASSITAAINPLQPISVQVSTGYTTNPDGKRVPAYAPPQIVMGDVQPLQFTDITLLDGLGIQGTRRKCYISGSISGLVRPNRQGGDLITLADGSIWLVAIVIEAWPDWTCAAITLQTPAEIAPPILLQRSP